VPDVQVGHHNKSSFPGVIRVNFTRAYWLYRVYRKNRDKNFMDKMTMFTGVQRLKLLVAPFLAVMLFFKNSPSLAFYKLIAGASWMAGTAWAYFKYEKK
jgi:hypothetical protein